MDTPSTSNIQKKVTAEQKKIIVEFIKKHDELQSGKFTNSFTYKDAQRLWMEVSDILNSMLGAKKDWKNWRKTWQDIKSRTKSRACEIKKYAQGTGGGPPLVCTDLDNDVIQVVKRVCVEGHSEIKESLVAFNFQNEDNTEETIIIDNSEEVDTEDQKKETNKPILSKENSLKNTTKVPRRKNQLTHDAEAVKSFQKEMSSELEIKKVYFKKKLQVLERIAVAKERSSLSKERIAGALEIIAQTLQELV